MHGSFLWNEVCSNLVPMLCMGTQCLRRSASRRGVAKDFAYTAQVCRDAMRSIAVVRSHAEHGNEAVALVVEHKFAAVQQGPEHVGQGFRVPLLPLAVVLRR